MARNRLPRRKAETAGSLLKNPGRFKGRPALQNAKPVGEPYPGMSPTEVKFWREFQAGLPWLRSSHRVLLRMACQFSARMDDGHLGVSGMHALSSMLSKLGATPVDEAKMPTRDPDDADAGEKFFGRPN